MLQEQLGGLAGTRFFSGTYDEAISLALRAREYLTGPGASARKRLDPMSSVSYSLESSRLVSRIAYLISWLLYQRAAHAGEMSPESAITESPELGDVGFCSGSWVRDPSGLPSGFVALWEESLRLYRRVTRLDEMVRRDLSRHDQAAPAPVTH